MVLYKNKPRKKVEGELKGYPYCAVYKYLGTQITNYLSIDKQIDCINSKATGLEMKLLAFRLNAGFRFNINFFKIMLHPQFKMLGVLW